MSRQILDPDYPCGSCGREVSDDDQAIDCDSCHTWFHIQCQGIGDDTYINLLNETSFSWKCITCDHINFSHSSKSFSLASGNSFIILSDSSESDRRHCKSLPYSKPDAAYARTSSMKIFNINANLSLIRGLNFNQSWILRNQIWLLAQDYTTHKKTYKEEEQGTSFFLSRNPQKAPLTVIIF